MTINAAIKALIWLGVLLLLVLLALGAAIYVKESGRWESWRASLAGEALPTTSLAPLPGELSAPALSALTVTIPIPTIEDEQPAPGGFNFILFGSIMIGLGLVTAMGALTAYFMRGSAPE